MTKSPSLPGAIPTNRDRKALRLLVRRLDHVKSRRLDDAICDIIDLKGFSLAALLTNLPRLKPSVALRVTRKIEDFLFFHPHAGKNLIDRLIRTVKTAPADCRPHLVAALADIMARTERPDHPDHRAEEVATEALATIETDTDLPRKAKAVEILSRGNRFAAVPTILAAMRRALHGIDEYAQFNFVETCLFALKKLGGESLLRLLVNPSSPQVAQHLRMHWRERDSEWVREIQQVVAAFPEDFPQIMLKVVELAEFNLPFAAMIQEGLRHKDRWVRQAAAASMSRMTTADGFEHLKRMLEDPAPEVRLMAVTSLGNYREEDTGELLVDLALNEQESSDIRMNAVYALFAQKNMGGLARVIQSPDRTVSLNAQGVSALLTTREEGLKALLTLIDTTPGTLLPDLFHYILEVARPEDLPVLLSKQDELAQLAKGDLFLSFLTSFLQRQDGPTLTAELAKVEPLRRQALELLLGKSVP